MARSLDNNGQNDTELEEEQTQNWEFQNAGIEAHLEELKQLKSRAKAGFTRSRHQLLQLLEEEDFPSRRQVRYAQQCLNSNQENAMEIMARLSDEYGRLNDRKSREKIGQEMEKLEHEFSEAQNRTQEYLDARRDEPSSVSSDVSATVKQLHLREIEARQQAERIQKEVRRKEEEVARLKREIETDFVRRQKTWEDQIRAEKERLFEANREVQVRREELEGEMNNELGLPSEVPERKFEHNPSNWMPVRGVPGGTSGKYVPDGIERFIPKPEPALFPRNFGPQTPSKKIQIGRDMWKQLKRVSIPVFSGDKRTYENWKAAFLACIDQALFTAEYKLLQLRQYLFGEALKSDENLGHSSTAYEAAKSRLESKYGGTRRQMAIYLEKLENFKPIRTGYAKDIEKCADLLDVAVALYLKLQRKVPESMLARYHRWIFETCRDESVETLREWVIQESEFQTIALETVRGLASTSREDIPKSKKGNTRTFFGSPQSEENRGGSAVATPRRSCKICNRQHGVWECDQFKKMNQTQRWDIAKQYKLCYRCLGDDHLGQACTRTRICGLDDCRETHNKPLHKKQNTGDRISEHMESKGMVKKSEKIGERPSSQVGINEKNLLEKASMLTSNVTEGELRGEPKTSNSSYTTTMKSKVSEISHPEL